MKLITITPSMSKTNSLPSAQTQHNSYAQATNPLPTKKQAILLPADEIINYLLFIIIIITATRAPADPVQIC